MPTSGIQKKNLTLRFLLVFGSADNIKPAHSDGQVFQQCDRSYGIPRRSLTTCPVMVTSEGSGKMKKMAPKI
jgi:hypothetical protein